MSEIEDLKKKVTHLEYDEINPIKTEINDMKVTLSNNDLLTKQAIESNAKLSTTMENFKDTMIEMAQSLKDANRISSELANTIVSLNDKLDATNTKMDDKFAEFSDRIDGVDTKINNVDDKSKVDISVWLKNNWFGVVGVIGIAYTVITQLFKIG